MSAAAPGGWFVATQLALVAAGLLTTVMATLGGLVLGLEPHLEPLTPSLASWALQGVSGLVFFALSAFVLLLSVVVAGGLQFRKRWARVGAVVLGLVYAVPGLLPVTLLVLLAMTRESTGAQLVD